MKPSELIANPENWCQKSLALDSKNIEVFLNDPHAIKFCAFGAILRCHTIDTAWSIREKLKEYLKIEDAVPTWNDAPERTHKEVIDALVAIGE